MLTMNNSPEVIGEKLETMIVNNNTATRRLSISSKIGLSIYQLRKETSSQTEVKLMAEMALMAEAKAGTEAEILVETETEAVVPEE